MLTIFACPKPFTDPHIATIQRNAITSWTLLRPRPEIILLGGEKGVAEICAELGLRHVPEIARNEFGTPLLSDIFQKGQELATNDILCYVNSDIILMSDFMIAIQTVTSWCRCRQFLVVGRRWDLDLTNPIAFADSTWEDLLRAEVLRAGAPRPANWIDYFVFPKGLFGDIPPFAIGRTTYDNWLIWKARSFGSPVIDASGCVLAVHQNHAYSHHAQGREGIFSGVEARRNAFLAGPETAKLVNGTDACTHVLTEKGVRLALVEKCSLEWLRWELNRRLFLLSPTAAKYWELVKSGIRQLI